LEWVGAVAPARPRVVLTHGENGSRAALAEKIEERFSLETIMPDMNDVIEI
jgi:metallo-beta-lactamase family protein